MPKGSGNGQVQMHRSTNSNVPKAWPQGIAYLRTPAYSKKLAAEATQTLVTPKVKLSESEQVYKVFGPYSRVKITNIDDPNHPAHGQCGLFAQQTLEPGSFILPYIGYVHDSTDTDEHSDYDLSLDREMGIGVDATRMGNEARFINDYRGVCSTPNAEFRETWIGESKIEKVMGVFVLSAGKSKKRTNGIRKGEEILVSYGKGFWTERCTTDPEA